MEFNEIKEAYIKLKTFAKESLKHCFQENKTDTAKYLSGYLDGLYMMYREVKGSEEALEKQIPKKPEVGEVLYYEGLSGYLCPICHNWLLCSDETPTLHDSFCSSCGQKIDWQR